ncbi:hypothetical protein M885DRAFT_511400 [Pelagophyceae sp. CCMP2097]|nr:hypothetical protein M885DRAFT_511400 [Pelagophyceae sp. CCMP2097]|mmetsp:Transcript_10835/g.36135  ORF Transcript_10835/g.36135 Transcript_10835/m.36135 type:complete len:280 (-) Transcript_10835:53-892(-)
MCRGGEGHEGSPARKVRASGSMLFRGGDCIWQLPQTTSTQSLSQLDLPPAPRKRTAVMCHGYHLQGAHWEKIMWGDEAEGKLGRVAKAAVLAFTEGADLLVLGSGASSHVSTGELEGAYTLRFLKERVHRLGLFGGLDHLDCVAVKEFVDSVAIAELESCNTRTELERLAVFLKAAAIDRVVLVSSPTHAPRCLRDACAVFKGFSPPIEIVVAPCDTSFAEPGDLCIIEPPHRGDRDVALDAVNGPPLHSLANRMLKLNPLLKADFARQLDQLLAQFEA